MTEMLLQFLLELRPGPEWPRLDCIQERITVARSSATLAELYERLGSLEQPSLDDPSEVWLRPPSPAQREWPRPRPLPDELQRWRLPAKGEKP